MSTCSELKLALILAMLSWTGLAMADLASYDDVWDTSQGVTVTDHSPTKYFNLQRTYSDPADMFGARNSSIEPGTFLWSDYYGTDTVHWVEWQTPEDVTIARFNLLAMHEDPYNRRSFDHFALYAWSNESWVTLYDQDITIPYGGGPNYNSIYTLELNEAVGAYVTTQRFRAEFTQYGGFETDARGPRIVELDGIVPEPDTLGLLAAGAMALLRRRRD